MKKWKGILLAIVMFVFSVAIFPGQVTQADTTTVTVNISAGTTARDINAALETEHEGKTLIVNFARGTYSLNATLYVYSNTTINATGARFVKENTRADGRSYGALMEAYLEPTMGRYNGSHDIKINGGTWDSTPVVNLKEGTETFRFIHCKNIEISNATFSNVPEGSHLVVLAGVQNATIDNCHFYGYKNWTTTKAHKEALQLDVTHSIKEVPTNQVSASDSTVWDDTACDQITIKNCEFNSFSRGVGSHTAVAGVFHTNVNIINNYFYKLSDAALKLFNYKDTTVSGNKIGYDKDGAVGNVKAAVLVYTWLDDSEFKDYYFASKTAVVLPSNYNIRIVNNVIKNVNDTSGTWGDGIRVIGAKDRQLTGVTISGNTISSTSRYGIYASYAKGIQVIGNNKLTSTQKDAILIGGCQNALVQSNTITSPKGCGIKISLGLDEKTNSSGSKAINNTIKTAKGTSNDAAVYVYKSPKCLVSGNTITSPNGDGVKVTTGCTGTIVEKNSITSPTVNGVTAYSSKQVNITDNNIITPKKDGVNVNTKSTSAVISGNKITKPGRAGVWMSVQSNGQILKNTIKYYAYKESTSGILVYESSGTAKTPVIVDANTIEGRKKYTGRHGIFVNGSKYVTCSNNKIVNADGEGITYYKNATNGILSKNKITTPTGGGINVTTSCASTKVLSNTISGAKNTAITVYASKSCTISKNIVSSKKDGINVNGGSNAAKIVSNTINSAGGSGISYTSSKSGTIKSNVIKKYAVSSKEAFGIIVYNCGGTKASNSAKILSNTVTGTGKGNLKKGIFVSSTNFVTLTSNKVVKPGAEGITVYLCKGATINKNTVTTTKTHIGIWLSQSEKGKLVSNTIKGANKKNAILITGTNKYTNKGNKIK